jgi:RNA recognition motif-containing protein
VRGHHIRVDLVEGSRKQFNTRLSIFVGNLAFSAEEEAVRRYFGQIGKVVNVRLIRDKQTSLGKGFGYVEFGDVDAVQAAVKLHGKKFQGRELRVFRAAKRDKVDKIQEKRLERTAGKPVAKKPQNPNMQHGKFKGRDKAGEKREKDKGTHQGFKANPKSVPKFKVKGAMAAAGGKGKLGKKKTKTQERLKKAANSAKRQKKLDKSFRKSK